MIAKKNNFNLISNIIYYTSTFPKYIQVQNQHFLLKINGLSFKDENAQKTYCRDKKK